MKPKDLHLISCLRQNGRETITNLSKETHIPISTIFDKLKTYQDSLIQKVTCLIDTKKLGYDLKVQLFFKVRPDEKDKFKSFLKGNPHTNTLYSINNNYDFFVEAIFRNTSDLNEFYKETEKFAIEQRQEHFVLEEVTKERFLSIKECLPTTS
ncbi:hypothetical protein KY327_01255 [Candidatus Woesearchaeota archaeon]|nr:hypothetical protein [Candidatus Woesearchaeota archaeon]